MRDFRDLSVWQKSVDLAVDVYRLTGHFPADERFGLTTQLRKAAVSISTNIAEGNGRGTRKDYAHFLMNSKASLNEVRSLLTVAGRLELTGIHETGPIDRRLDEISKMLMALRTSLLKKPS